MPELPDITVYLEALERRVVGQVLQKIRVLDVFVLRTAVPPVTSLEGVRINSLRRLGKRIVFGFEGDRWLVLHLMVAGRLQWQDVVAGVADPGDCEGGAKRTSLRRAYGRPAGVGDPRLLPGSIAEEDPERARPVHLPDRHVDPHGGGDQASGFATRRSRHGRAGGGMIAAGSIFSLPPPRSLPAL